MANVLLGLTVERTGSIDACRTLSSAVTAFAHVVSGCAGIGKGCGFRGKEARKTFELRRTSVWGQSELETSRGATGQTLSWAGRAGLKSAVKCSRPVCPVCKRHWHVRSKTSLTRPINNINHM
eukprot:1748910-Pleurochrysis_carterae.AAC.2